MSKQPFSAVRLTTPEEFYLVTNPTDGTILKAFPSASGLPSQIFFSGLNTPVKLKLHDGFVYVVEAGNLLQGSTDSGQVSRIPLDNPTTREILVTNLNNPQGFDIFGDKMAIMEVGQYRILEASSVAPSTPSDLTILIDKLALSSDLLAYVFGRTPIDPTADLTYGPDGESLFFIETKTNSVNVLDLRHHRRTNEVL